MPHNPILDKLKTENDKRIQPIKDLELLNEIASEIGHTDNKAVQIEVSAKRDFDLLNEAIKKRMK